MADLELNNPFVRRKLLVARLESGQSLVASGLAEEFDVSLDTIRRDLLALEDEGLVKRVRGGAMPIRLPAAPIFQRSAEANHPAREEMAKAALALIEDGMTMVFDGGTTLQKLANHLPSLPNSLIITPSPAIAQISMANSTPTYLIGGRLCQMGGIAVGHEAESSMRNKAADVCFLGACGLEPGFGLSADDDQEAGLRRAMVEISNSNVVLATKDKFASRARHKVMDTSQLNIIITDAEKELTQGFSDEGVEVIHV